MKNQTIAYGINFFLFYLGFGLVVPYFPVLYERMGFNAFEIGILSSIQPLTICVIPPLVGWWLSKSGYSRKRVLEIISFWSLAFCPFLFRDKMTLLIATLLFGGHFLGRILFNPVLDTVCMDFCRMKNADYGKMRLWGSFGFLVSSYFGAATLASEGTSVLLYFYSAFVALCALGVFTLKEPEVAHKETETETPTGFKWTTPQILLLLTVFLINFSLMPYYVYYSLYLTNELGLQVQWIGNFWGIAVIAEILLMFFASRWFKNWTPISMMTIALIITSLRWFGYWYCESKLLAVFLQISHAFTFACFHLGCMKLISQLFPTRYHSFGFTFYNAVAFGFSGIGMIVAGYFHDIIGVRGLFLSAGFVPLGGLFLLHFLKQNLQNTKDCPA
jgi:PPP family 3-phenylpropionic acid transporter